MRIRRLPKGHRLKKSFVYISKVYIYLAILIKQFLPLLLKKTYGMRLGGTAVVLTSDILFKNKKWITNMLMLN